ncbi:MAG: FAD:protein FMN transferase [Thalassotalea sp.]
MKYFVCWLLYFLLPINSAYANWHQKTFHVMGTAANVEFWHHDQATSLNLIRAVEAEMERINQLMSPYIETSELAKINKSAALAPVVISTELFNLITVANQISELSQGAFDITYASIGYKYQYRNKVKPNEQTISQSLNKINYQGIKLDNVKETVFFTKAGMKIDLGGIAKGYAVDNCLKILKTAGVNHGLVSAGGDTGLLGDRRGRPWIVGIKHPRAADKTAVHLPLTDEAISTSGDYERYFIEDGERYHHILNPKTGKSAQAVVSVSVIGKDPTMVDALSTTLFVLGLKPAMALIDSLAGYEAIIIDKQQRLHFSTGLTQ